MIASAVPGRAEEPAAAPPAAAPPPPVRLVASVGYDYGINRFLTVTFDDGSTQSLRLNGGSFVAVGAAFFPLEGGRFETRGTIGVKYDAIRATNGSVRYLAFPLEVSESLYARPVRLTLGVTVLLAPGFKGEDFLAAVDLDLKPSVGIVGQAEWVLPFRTGRGTFSAGLRLTWQRLEPRRGGAAEDASALGAIVDVTL